MMDHEPSYCGQMQPPEIHGDNVPPLRHLSDEEFEFLLDELAKGPKASPLPADFSRADIYTDHD
jgi:hypothetical protein